MFMALSTSFLDDMSRRASTPSVLFVAQGGGLYPNLSTVSASGFRLAWRTAWSRQNGP